MKQESEGYNHCCTVREKSISPAIKGANIKTLRYRLILRYIKILMFAVSHLFSQHYLFTTEYNRRCGVFF